MKRPRHVGNPGWATLLVLGMLFPRALVPAGFMLAPMDGHLAVVLCDAEISAGAHRHQPGHEYQPGHQHHHHHLDQGGAAPQDGGGAHHDGAPHDGDGPSHYGAHADPTCPYAQSAGPAPLPALPVLAGGAVSDRPVLPAFITQTFLTCGPVRQQTSRGPPSLA